PSASIHLRVSRPISLTTPTRSSIGLPATCRWMASASLPSTCPSAQAESTISWTTRSAWTGSKRSMTPLCPRGAPRSMQGESFGPSGRLAPLQVSFQEEGEDHQDQQQRDAYGDLQPAH